MLAWRDCTLYAMYTSNNYNIIYITTEFISKDYSYTLKTVAKRITCFENDVAYFEQLQILCIIGK
jgi:hypothetical protein